MCEQLGDQGEEMWGEGERRGNVDWRWEIYLLVGHGFGDACSGAKKLEELVGTWAVPCCFLRWINSLALFLMGYVC